MRNNSNMETHAHRMRRARARLGVTQQEMARRLGISRVVYARWESLKDCQLPPSNRMLPLREALDCDLDWLLSGEKEGEPWLHQ